MARANNPGPKPHERMPTWKFVAALVVAGLFDALKFCCIFIIFLGPVIAGAVAAGEYGSIVGWLVGLGVAAASLIPAVAGFEEFFGSLAAMLISLVGWLAFTFWFILSGVKLNKAGGKNLIALVAGWFVSEIPLIDLIPSFTPSIWYICNNERKEYKKMYAKWKAESDAYQRQQLQERQAYIAQVQANQAARVQQEAAAAQEEIPEELAQAT